MSSRSTYYTLFALNDQGEKQEIYFLDSYAGGCEYTNRVGIRDMRYEVTFLPTEEDEDTVEEGVKLPILNIEDTQSYFTEAPTQAMTQTLQLAEVAQLPISQFVWEIKSAVSGNIYELDIITIAQGYMETKTCEYTEPPRKRAPVKPKERIRKCCHTDEEETCSKPERSEKNEG